MDWSQFQYTHYDGRTVGSLTICGQQAITELSLSLRLNWTSHVPLWAGVVCSPCSLRCRQFQFEILRSTRVGSKKWESLKIFTASQGRLREFYVTFYGADVTVTVTSRCCWHSSAGFRRQRQLTQFVLEMNSSSHCSKEMREFFELQFGQLTITQTTKTPNSEESSLILETSPWYDPILYISHIIINSFHISWAKLRRHFLLVFRSGLFINFVHASAANEILG